MKDAPKSKLVYIPLRYIFAIILTVLEAAAIIGIVVALCCYIPYFYIMMWGINLICVIRIVASDDNPDYKVPWLILVLLLPVIGLMLYFIFGSRKLTRAQQKNLGKLRQLHYKKDDSASLATLKALNRHAHNEAKMLCKIADTALFTDTETTYYPTGEALMAAMLADLTQAKRFIYMEYFIIADGVLWQAILDILKEKAAAGVDVRVVFDDIGCMTTLKGNYAKILQKHGIAAIPFNRLRGSADSRFNNRSHRKITVIDGEIGYTGGANIADEYINQKNRFGHWKDAGLRLSGEAVYELTRLFMVDYVINKRALPDDIDALYPALPPRKAEGYVIPFGDGPRPLYRRAIGKHVIQNMLASATRYVYMTTPYLIIDNDLCTDIENAALRGIDVRIIVPHIPDKRLVFEMTRSYYPRLARAGVKIYEYTPGFIHAKCYLADDTTALIGTFNLDYRSLVHHFENGVWLYKTDAIPALKADLEATLQISTPILEADLHPSLRQRIFRAMVRIFAPLL
ncbi:MAG: cardiolipin synthase [Clostridia bacterium]|nr:cardiolipin synthase [Clostridia bacterium]